MRYGIFGGTFDPPHLGHLILAAEAYFQLTLERLLWVLTPDPPHKKGRPITPLVQRLALMQSAIGDNPAFELSRVDIDRSGPYYALDTMRILTAKYPRAELIYLMGGDSLMDLPGWYRPLEFLSTCHALGIMRRPGEKIDLSDLEEKLPGIGDKVRIIEAPLIEIAASEIRRRVANGQPYRYYIQAGVWKLIEELRLYKDYQ